jgi:hypothetical protein
MSWRRVPRFTGCDMRSTYTIHAANQKAEEDLEVETYIYEDSRLVRIED